MKYFLLGLFFIQVIFGNEISNRKDSDENHIDNNFTFVSESHLGEKLLGIFNTWIQKNVILDFPRLDPLIIPDVEGSYNENGIKLSYSLGKICLTGMRESTVEDLFASEKNLMIRGKFVAPNLTITADNYEMNGRFLYFLPLKGSGHITAYLEDSVLLFKMQLGENGISTNVEDLDLNLDIGNVKIEMTGTSSIIQNAVNLQAKKLLTSYRTRILSTITSAIKLFVNEKLTNVSPEEILTYIHTLYIKSRD